MVDESLSEIERACLLIRSAWVRLVSFLSLDCGAGNETRVRPSLQSAASDAESTHSVFYDQRFR